MKGLKMAQTMDSDHFLFSIINELVK